MRIRKTALKLTSLLLSLFLLTSCGEIANIIIDVWNETAETTASEPSDSSGEYLSESVYTTVKETPAPYSSQETVLETYVTVSETDETGETGETSVTGGKTPETTPRQTETSGQTKKSVFAYSDRYYYNALLKINNGKKLQEIYALMYDAMYKMHNESKIFNITVNIKSVNWTADHSELQRVTFALQKDFPEFYATNEYYYWWDQSTKKGTSVEIARDMAISDNDIKKYNAALEKKFAEYKVLTEGKSEYETAKLVHNKLIEETHYNQRAADLNDTDDSAEIRLTCGILGAMTDYFDGTVCRGYSEAYSYIMNRLGVDAVYVPGDAGGAHAWNYVKIDGKWYFADVTWDGSNYERYGDSDKYKYEYFLKGSAFAAKTHEPHDYRKEDWAMPLPALSKTDYEG